MSVYSLRIVFLLRWIMSEPWHFLSVTISVAEEMWGPASSRGSSSWMASTARPVSRLSEVSTSERARSMAVSGSRYWNLILVAKGRLNEEEERGRKGWIISCSCKAMSGSGYEICSSWSGLGLFHSWLLIFVSIRKEILLLSELEIIKDEKIKRS